MSLLLFWFVFSLCVCVSLQFNGAEITTIFMPVLQWEKWDHEWFYNLPKVYIAC